MADTKLGTAFIPIRATLDQLDDDLKSARQHTEHALDGVRDLGKLALGWLAAGALAVTAAIGTIGPAAVSAASDLNESMSKAQVVFDDAVGAIDDFASTSAKSFGIARQAAYEATGTFGNLFVTMGLGQADAADMSVDIIKLAADLASFNNLDTVEVFDKLRSGLIGEAEPMRSLGVMLTEDTVKAKAFALGLASATKPLTESAKLQARYALIMEQTGTAQGDFARTSTGLANTQRILGATFKDIQARIGAALLPLVLKLANAIVPIAEALLPHLETGLKAIAPIMEMVGGNIKRMVEILMAGGSPLEAMREALYGFGGAREIFDQIVAGVQGFIAAIQPTVDQVRAWLSENVQLNDVLIALGVAIAAVIVPAILSVVAAVAPVVAAFVGLVAIVAGLRAAWETDWNGMRTTLTAFWENTARPALEQLWQWLQVAVPQAIETLAAFWTNTLQPALAAVWAFIQTSVIPALGALFEWLQINIPLAIQALVEFWNGTLMPALTAFWEFLNTYVMPMLQSFWAYITEFVLPILQKLAALGIDVVSASLKGLWGIWTDLLYPAFQTMWNFLTKNILPVLIEVARVVRDVLGSAFEWARVNILNPFIDALTFIKGFIDEIIAAIRKMQGALAGTVLPGAGTQEGRAAGGPVSAFTPYTVGERGPETFVPAVDGSIVPAGQSVTNNWNLTINTSAPAENLAADFAMLQAMAG